MMADTAQQEARCDQGVVLTNAVVRAAAWLDVPAGTLGAILGVSPFTVSRMKAGNYTLSPGTKSFEMAVLFVRLFRALDAITGGDEAAARAWMHNANVTLDGYPLDVMENIDGVSQLTSYLENRAACSVIHRS